MWGKRGSACGTVGGGGGAKGLLRLMFTFFRFYEPEHELFVKLQKVVQCPRVFDIPQSGHTWSKPLLRLCLFVLHCDDGPVCSNFFPLFVVASHESFSVVL